MNNKEFINRLAELSETPAKDVQHLIDVFISETANAVDEESALAVHGFGTFEVKKKMERIVVNPTTKQRMLVPPKLVLSYKPSATLKEKMKSHSGSPA